MLASSDSGETRPLSNAPCFRLQSFSSSQFLRLLALQLAHRVYLNSRVELKLIRYAMADSENATPASGWSGLDGYQHHVLTPTEAAAAISTPQLPPPKAEFSIPDQEVIQELCHERVAKGREVERLTQEVRAH